LIEGSRHVLGAVRERHHEVVRLIRTPPPALDPAVELAVARALLQRVSRGELPDTLRVSRPSRPVVVFGRRDTRQPGWADAVRRAREAGFEPLVRAVGGRAVAYTQSALVVDAVVHAHDSAVGMDERFRVFGDLYADVLRDLGVDARVGSVPGEYCPGAQSVNARGVVKLVGTAQRVVRDAWLFSALVIVADEQVMRPVLAGVYESLDQPLDVSAVSSVTAEVPALDLERVEGAILAAYGATASLEPGELDASTLELAHRMAADHRA
jgi:lipoate-protein ligase A